MKKPLFIKFLMGLETSNQYMFGRAIWDKLPNSIFEIFNFSKITRLNYLKNYLNQTCGY